MPRIACFAAILLLALAAAEVAAQQFMTESFGAELDGRLSLAAPDIHTPGGSADRLVQPAGYESAEGDVRSVQHSGYAAPMGEDSLKEPASMDEPTDSEAEPTAKRDLGFPSLAPSDDPTSGGGATGVPSEGVGSVVTVISSLAIVLGLFFMTAWLMRRATPGGPVALPSDVFEVLGRSTLNARQQVHLLRCGTKLLLVSITQDGAETLTEIDDPDEVTRMAGLCKASQAGSTTAAFRQVLHQFPGQKAEPGFTGQTEPRPAHPPHPSELEGFHG